MHDVVMSQWFCSGLQVWQVLPESSTSLGIAEEATRVEAQVRRRKEENLTTFIFARCSVWYRMQYKSL
jgi:hypothetical protein